MILINFTFAGKFIAGKRRGRLLLYVVPLYIQCPKTLFPWPCPNELMKPSTVQYSSLLVLKHPTLIQIQTMENNCRIVAVLAVLAFLSSPPTLSGQRIQGQAVDQYLKKLFKRIERVIDIIDMGSNAYDVLKNLEISDSTEERSQLPGVIPSGFFLNFTVGSSSQQKEATALMSLSSVFTVINNPIYSGTLQCCNLANPNSCGPAAQPGNNLPYTPCLNR